MKKLTPAQRKQEYLKYLDSQIIATDLSEKAFENRRQEIPQAVPKYRTQTEKFQDSKTLENEALTQINKLVDFPDVALQFYEYLIENDLINSFLFYLPEFSKEIKKVDKSFVTANFLRRTWDQIRINIIENNNTLTPTPASLRRQNDQLFEQMRTNDKLDRQRTDLRRMAEYFDQRADFKDQMDAQLRADLRNVGELTLEQQERLREDLYRYYTDFQTRRGDNQTGTPPQPPPPPPAPPSTGRSYQTTPYMYSIPDPGVTPGQIFDASTDDIGSQVDQSVQDRVEEPINILTGQPDTNQRLVRIPSQETARRLIFDRSISDADLRRIHRDDIKFLFTIGQNIFGQNFFRTNPQDDTKVSKTSKRPMLEALQTLNEEKRDELFLKIQEQLKEETREPTVTAPRPPSPPIPPGSRPTVLPPGRKMKSTTPKESTPEKLKYLSDQIQGRKSVKERVQEIETGRNSGQLEQYQNELTQQNKLSLILIERGLDPRLLTDEFNIQPPQIGNPKRYPTPQQFLRMLELRGFIQGQPQSGTGIKYIDSHKRIKNLKIGKGLEANTRERFAQFGKYYIHTPSLENNFLNIRFPSLAINYNLQPRKISSQFRDFLLDSIDNSNIDKKQFQRLSDEEKNLFMQICRMCKIKFDFDQDDIFREKLKRFEILKNEVIAGNDNRDLIKELKEYIEEFLHDGIITKNVAYDLIKEISVI